ILRDISKRKQAELKLRRSEANLAAAQRFAHLGSFEQDLADLDELEKNPQRWSDEVFRIFGYEPGRIDTSAAALLRAAHSDDRDRLRSVMVTAIRDGKSHSLEDRKSTRLNSSHVAISYAVFCLKKKKKKITRQI